MSYPEVYYTFYKEVSDVYMNAIAGEIKTYDEFCKKIHNIYSWCCGEPGSEAISNEDETFIDSAREAETNGIALKDYAFNYHTLRQSIVNGLEKL